MQSWHRGRAGWKAKGPPGKVGLNFDLKCAAGLRGSEHVSEDTIGDDLRLGRGHVGVPNR